MLNIPGLKILGVQIYLENKLKVWHLKFNILTINNEVCAISINEIKIRLDHLKRRWIWGNEMY